MWAGPHVPVGPAHVSGHERPVCVRPVPATPPFQHALRDARHHYLTVEHVDGAEQLPGLVEHNVYRSHPFKGRSESGFRATHTAGCEFSDSARC